MRSFQQKRRWRSLLESWPVLILCGILLLMFAWSVLSFFGKMRTARENRALAEAKVAELTAKKAKLSSDIEKLKTDEGKEEIFRENFGLAKAGEGLTVIVEDKNNKSNTENNDNDRWYSFLFFWNWLD